MRVEAALVRLLVHTNRFIMGTVINLTSKCVYTGFSCV